MQTENQRVKLVLTEAITLLCKSILSYRTEFCVEGLLAVTVDNSEVHLINIREVVNTSTLGDSSFVGTPTVILVAPQQMVESAIAPLQTSDLSQVVFGFDGLIPNGAVVVESVATEQSCDVFAEVTTSLKYEQKSSNDENGEEGDDANDITTKCENTVAAAEIVQSSDVQAENYVELDTEPRSSLNFTSAELDEFIGSVTECQTADVTETSCDVFAEVTTSLKYEQKSSNDENGEEGDTRCIVMETTVDTDPLLLSSEVDDQISNCLPWDVDDLSDIGPLNLAGPQDLSTGLGKKKFVCPTCGHRFETEELVVKHDCKEQTNTDTDDSLLAGMPEPLNLISRPLDLTVGVRMDDDDDDPDSVYGMLMSAAAGVAAEDRLACICGKTFESSAPEKFTSHVASCAKSKLTPYKSCETCGKTLFSNSGYVKHLRLHVGAYKYNCKVCRRGFFDQTNLQAHTDSKHSKVRRYACSHCNKSFYWKHHMKRHLGTCGRGNAT